MATPSWKPDDLVLQDRVQANTVTLGRIMTLGALIAGVVAGLLGVTGILGLVVYLVAAFTVTRIVTTVHCNGKPEAYFLDGQLSSPGHYLSGGLTFLLSWTIAHDAIYFF